MELRQAPEGLLAWLEWLEQWGYITAGLSFLLLGMLTFAYSWVTFFATLNAGILKAVLILTNDLLFVIILLELFRTVVNFLKSRVITLEPFLYVGIIAGLRRILTSGTQLIHFEQMDQELFERYLWDAGANLIIVFVLVLGIFIFKYARIDAKPVRA
ncbi:MAG: phosphate-starvation-inducible PsiE family protein [Nitrospirota bacterium]